MDNFVNITEAAKYLGVSKSTLRRWDNEGVFVAERTKGGQRRYLKSKLDNRLGKPIKKTQITIAYARVSSLGQSDDLQRQKEVLSLYCAAKGWNYELIIDIGSGINYQKKGLKRLLDLIVNDEVKRLVLVHKDRLLRFGADLIFSICETKAVEVILINQGSTTSFEEDLAEDVLEIITVFSAKLSGSLSHKNKKLLAQLKEISTP